MYREWLRFEFLPAARAIGALMTPVPLFPVPFFTSLSAHLVSLVVVSTIFLLGVSERTPSYFSVFAQAVMPSMLASTTFLATALAPVVIENHWNAFTSSRFGQELSA
jgi:hypothetical protein